jgi:hypothetical protein
MGETGNGPRQIGGRVTVQDNIKAAPETVKSVLVVAADPQPLTGVIATAAPAPRVVEAGSATEAKLAATGRTFHAIIVDLRNGDAQLALAIPQLADLQAAPHLVVIAPQGTVPALASYPGVTAVIIAPFSTEKLLGQLHLDAPQTAGSILRFRDRASALEAATGAIRVLFFPSRPDGLFLPEGAVAVDASVARPDIIVLTETNMARRLSAVLPRPVAAVAPVIDITGGNAEIADTVLNRPSQIAIADAIAALAPTVERARALPPEVFLSERDGDVLLARLAVRERGIMPGHTPLARAVVTSPDAHTVFNLSFTAETLVASGALRKRFFERLNCCPSCDSARVVLREECRKCRSADVEEVSIIHHFRCGYQAPERDFIEGNGLRCPKCVHALEAFSVDYDRPGSLMVCNACKNETGEAAVGFRCLDCSVNEDASKLVARTYHQYELTEAAARILANSFVNSAPAPSEAPAITPQAQVAKFIRAMEAANQDFSAMLVRVDRDGAVRREHGERGVRGSIHLIERALREAIAVDFEAVRLDNSLALLLPYGDASALRAALPEFVSHAKSAISLPLDIAADVISGDRLKEIVFDPVKRRKV